MRYRSPDIIGRLLLLIIDDFCAESVTSDLPASIEN